MDMLNLTLTEARARVGRGELPPHDLARACLRQIERLNPDLNAFITVADVIARSETTKQSPAPEEIASPWRRGDTSGSALAMTLAGMPIAVKDIYDTAGVRTTAGSLFFKDHIPAEDAVVVRKLHEAGALIVGKTNTHEVALGVTNVNPHFGPCRNPWDRERVSGGSSGGSAVAVASGMALAALGTDTGGSIRIPASLCGVVGLKPTYGRVSLRGVLPLSWTLDHAGPLTKSARDAALMLQVIAGYDAADPATVNIPVDDYQKHIEDGVQGWKIAFAVGPYVEESEAEVLAAVRAAADVFSGSGARVDEVEIEWLREAALTNALITQADGAAFHRWRLAEHPEWFGADVRQRLEAGAAYTSNEYALARRAQAEVRRKAEQLFGEYDLLVLPTTPIAAPLIEGSDAIEQARRLTRFTAPFNLSGLPAISIPCGFTQTPEVFSAEARPGESEKTSGVSLPIGLQLVSAHWGEARLLQAAHAFEQATDWHKHRPPLGATEINQ